MEWYNRHRSYSNGDYDKSIRKYYNEDSNKWVSNPPLNKIIEKYIRYEFSCFDDREIENHFGWSNIDRVGKYIFLIYKKTISISKLYGREYVYLDKINDEKRLLGYNHYKEIVDKLKELKIIKIRVDKKVFSKSVSI